MLVEVAEVPVDLYFANAEQLTEAIAALSSVSGSEGLALPLTPTEATRTASILHRYAAQREAAAFQAGAARERGDSTFTLEIDLPEHAGDDLDHLLELFDRIDDLCAEQDMAWPAPIAVRAFRRSTLRSLAARVREAHAQE